jgi:hypothetical protein
VSISLAFKKDVVRGENEAIELSLNSKRWQFGREKIMHQYHFQTPP